MPIDLEGFSGGATIVDYGAIATGETVHNKLFGDVLHEFAVGGVASPAGAGLQNLGATNHMAPASVMGIATGVLSLRFLTPQTRLGYGWAGDVTSSASTSVELFDAADNSLGSLSFVGAPDPVLTGGFAALQSTTPFARAEVSWVIVDPTTGQSGLFGFDNLRFESVSEVPLPAAMWLLGPGLAGLFGFGLRRHGR